MSFIDPDLREQWAKDTEAKRAICRVDGHKFTGIASCDVCGVENPKAKKPRVVLSTRDYRAIFVPDTGKIVIELRGVDNLGADRWDLLETLDPKDRNNPLNFPIFSLLKEGKAP